MRIEKFQKRQETRPVNHTRRLLDECARCNNRAKNEASGPALFSASGKRPAKKKTEGPTSKGRILSGAR